MRLDIPPGGATPLDHRADLFAEFNRYYGTLWSRGVLDQATKEVGRLRNARVTGCGICKNLRFAGAKEAGLHEELVELITDDYDASALPARWKLAVQYADVLIADPKSLDAELRSALLAEFTPAEIVELTATVTTAVAFSKAAVAFGAPLETPVLEVPTPTVDDGAPPGG